MDTTSAVEAVAAIIVGTSVVAVAVLLVVGLLKAGRLPPSVALVISLSILTLVAMVGFIFTLGDNQSAELATLAGTGLGALAGAVTAVWADTRGVDQPTPPAVDQPTPPAVDQPTPPAVDQLEQDPGA